MRKTLILGSLILLAGCSSNGRDSAPVTAATPLDPLSLAAAAQIEAPDYRIGSGDTLRVSVFQIEALSFDELVVDASGLIEMPLIGSVQAAGRTPAELSAALQTGLGERYLRNPQVSVSVVKAASDKVTVDGSVTKPGVYELQGRTTLLQAVAMAEGPSRVAKLDSVAVFRTTGGQRTVAVFDLNAIRNGHAADPVILGDDVIVVDSSRLSGAFRDVVAFLPVLGAFVRY